MRIDQLRQIREIGRAGSINRAAENLFLSQSSLSLSLRSAESELGQPIFERSYNGVRVTPFGAGLLQEIETILDCWDRIEKAAGEQARHRKGASLRVSSQYLLFVSSIFAELLAAQSGNGDFSLREKSWDAICRDVEQGESDIGILCTPHGDIVQRRAWLGFLSGRGLSYHMLALVKTIAMLGPPNRLYRLPGDSIKMSQLLPYSMVYYKSEMEGIGTEILESALLPHIPCKGVVAVSDRGSLHNLLLHSDNFSIGGWSAAYQQIGYYRDIRALEIEDAPFFIEIGWIQREGRPLSPLEKTFVRRVEGLLARRK